MAIADYWMGGNITSSDIAKLINKNEEKVREILSQNDKEYNALPSDEEGRNKEQDQKVEDFENAIIDELLEL